MANSERQQHLLRLTQLRLTLDRDHKDATERRQHQEIDDCIIRAVERLEVYNTVERVHVVGFEASTPTAMSLADLMSMEFGEEDDDESGEDEDFDPSGQSEEGAAGGSGTTCFVMICRAASRLPPRISR